MNNRIKKGLFFALNLFLLGSSFSSVNILRADTLRVNDQSIISLRDELAATAQHFAFISYGLIVRTTKNKAENTSITLKEQKVVERIDQSYVAHVKQIRPLLYSATPSLEEAVKLFGDYVLQLCREFGVRKKYYMSFPAEVDASTSLENQLALIVQVVEVLEKYFETIHPVAPLFTRIKNKLFYNFASTKVAPKVLSIGVGPVLAGLWAVKNGTAYEKLVDRHPHENIFKSFTPVPHDQEQDFIKEPSLIEKVMGVEPKEGKINSCRSPYRDHLCNGAQPRTFEDAPDDRDQIQQLFQGVVMGQQYNPGQREVRWASGCGAKSKCSKCYRYNGFHSPEKIAAKVAWAARPVALLPLFYALGQSIEEAQLPEYQRRIKLKEKAEQERKVQQEMRRMKVNYEKTIGFEQIKGQKELIEREIKMLVDYLRNPFRYQNSASGTRSVLMYGPPGTGKTLMARAIAKESGAPFLEISADDIMCDDSKEKVLATMRMAEEVASKRPEKSAIIYIDEIDAVTGNRQNGALDPQRAKALSNLLTIFDGIEKRNPFVHIVIIITTNHYKNLDPALLRPGRIDRKILISQPNTAGREEFFQELLPTEHKGYMEWLVEETEGYSGAQIVNVVDTAQMVASYNDRKMPDRKDYEAALQNSKVEQEEIPENAKVY